MHLEGGGFTENLSDRINLVVEKSGLTKTAFAKRLNISQAMASQMCAGKAKPSDRTISDICLKFRINEEWLRTGKGEMEVADPQRVKLEKFFADVLATCPDERSDLVAALADLPPEFWKMAAQYTRSYIDNIKKED